MKKTLTANLGGTVFHIDEDAYRLLDDYFRNLKLHFNKQEGAEEIVNDIEIRISELFTEKLKEGSRVITISDVEEVIARMGKPEELAGEETGKENSSKSSSESETSYSTTTRRLYRNPDDKLLGGVIGGIAAYFGWDVTLLRFIALIFLVLGYGTLIPVYLVCWLLIPEAHTAAEKLNMHGKDVTIENIGKTVTNGFEKMANGINDFVNSEKPRTFLQKLGDLFISIVGFILKACLIVFAIICSPVLFAFAVVFVVLVIGAIVAAIGGVALLYEMIPMVDWSLLTTSPMMTICGSIGGVLLVGIPLAGLLYEIFRQIFKWPSMAPVLKWSLFFLWIIGLIAFLVYFSASGWFLPHHIFLHV